MSVKIQLLIWISLFFRCSIYAQEKAVNVYIFPGTGSDERLFSKLVLPAGFEARHIFYPIPEKRAKMSGYAKSLLPQIDTTQPFVLLGVSVGGMICTELTDLINPKKTIIISSAKCRNELPWQYRFQKYIPINKVLGARFIKAMSFVAQVVVEPDSKHEKPVFKAMLRSKNPKYIKRTVNMIVNWERETYSPNIVHIHGTKDHTLPLKNIKPSIMVKDGSHMMTLTRGEEISTMIEKVLLEK